MRTWPFRPEPNHHPLCHHDHPDRYSCSGQRRSWMRCYPINDRTQRNDTARIDLIVRHEVVALDMVEIHTITKARPLIEIARIAPEMGIVNQAAQIALEMPDIDHIKAHQRGK